MTTTPSMPSHGSTSTNVMLNPENVRRIDHEGDPTMTTDQSAWPAHLRDDAPSQRCGRCGRHTWSPEAFGAEDRMTQPDGYPCGGRFESMNGAAR